MANILILTLVFPPDSVSTAQIMGELAKDLQGSGHKVTVLTTSPHYNRDMEAELRQPLHRYWGPILRKSNHAGIEVYHTFMPRKGNSVFLRLLSWIGFHLISTIAGMTVIPKPNIIIAPSPPLTIGLCAWILGKFHHASYIYNVQEIYPDIAIRLGALRNKYLIGLLLRLERFVYKKASGIAVIAPRMRNRLLRKGVPADKVKVIPNFVDIDDLRPLEKDNDFSRRHGIHNKFVISYAGNVGPAQGLDKFIDVAASLHKEQGIHFMMIGNGVLWNTLEQRVSQLGLTNFTCLAYQPYSLMPKIYAASDICLVPQAPETGCDAIPSKVYRIMACGRPVLAFTDSNSDLAHLISSVGCGIVVQGRSSRVLTDNIINAYKNQAQCRRMGELGRAHVEKHYARKVVTNHYQDLIRMLTISGFDADKCLITQV
jgi:colanic acid biosynthesis glycosyl transferase WcaI